MIIINADIGNRLKESRRKKGLTQAKAASMIGVSKNIISSYELYLRSPSIDVLVKLAHLYGVTTDYLLGIEPKIKAIDVSDLTDKQVQSIQIMIDTFKHP